MTTSSPDRSNSSRRFSSSLVHHLSRRVICAVSIGAVLGSTQVHAASQTWSATPSDANFGTVTDWVGGAAPGLATGGYTNASTTSDVATFNAALSGGIGGAGNPIVIDVNRFLKSIAFTAGAGAYVIGTTAGTLLQLNNGGSVTMAAGVSSAEVINNPIQVRAASSTNATYTFQNDSTTLGATLSFGATAFTLTAANGRPTSLILAGANAGPNVISSNITDAMGLQGVNVITKNGTGTWVLSGANVFTGSGATNVANGIQINGGVLSAQNNTALGFNATANANQVSINNGGTLELANSITLDNGISLNLNNGGTIRSNGSTSTNARINISAAAATTVTLSTTNAADVFTVGNAANDLTGGAAGTTTASVSGPGTVVLANASNYLGAWSLDGGLTRLGAATALGDATVVSVGFGAGSTGVLQLNGNNVSIAGLITNAVLGTAAVESGAGASTLTVNNAGANTFAGTLRDGGAGVLSLTKGGGGILTLSGANTYSGATSIGAGVLLAANATGSATGTGAVSVSGTGTLAGTGSVSGGVTINSGATIAPGNAGVGVLTLGALTLNAGSVLGYDIASPSNLDQILVTGALSINGGRLDINGGSLPFSTNGVYNLIGFTGALGGTGALSLNAANKDVSKAYTFGSANNFVTLTVANSGVSAAYWNSNANGNWSTGPWTSAVPNAIGAFAAFGGGGTAITQARSISVDGAFTVGTLSFADNLNAYTLSAGPGALLTLDNGASGAFVTASAGSHAIQSPLVLGSSGATFTVTQAADTLSVSGAITGLNASLTKAGSGKLALTGDSQYSGGTILNAGLLQINSPTSLGDAAGVLTFGGGTLQLLADVVTARPYQTSASSDVNIDTNGFSLTLNGAITPQGAASGGLIKQGAGTLTLAGANAYAGPTQVRAGTLSVSANANLGDPATGAGLSVSGAILASTATFALDNGGLNNRPVTLGTGGATFQPAAATTLTISGGITGSGGLIKTGAGALLLTANNAITLSAPITLSAGTLALGGGLANSFQALGTGALTFVGGTLSLNGFGVNDNGTSYGTLANAITVAAGQSGTINLPKRLAITSALSGTGTLTLNADGFRDDLNANWSTFAGQLNINTAGTGAEFRLLNTNGLASAKVALGANVTLHQVLTGSGDTVQNVGELSGAAGSFLGGSSVTTRVVTWAVGALNTNATFAGNIYADTGVSRLSKVGTGTLTLTGANTYTGLTQVNAGNLTIAGGTTGSTGAVIEIAPALASVASLTVQSGATVNASRVTIASDTANTTGGAGTLIQSGGTVNVVSWFSVGEVGTGTFQMSSGILNVNTGTGATLEVATFGTASGSLSVSGDAQINLQNNASFVLGVQNTTGNGTVTQSGGAVNFFADAGTVSGGTGGLYLGGGTASGVYTYNLNGGTLNAPQITHVSGTGILNFNGGNLKATGPNTAFVANLSAANVQAGGAKMDDGGFAVTVAQALLHDPALGATADGGLLKTGAGTLTLSGANTFTGATVISSGTLLLTGSLAGPVTLSAGATLGGTGNAGGAISGSGTVSPGAAGIGQLTVAGGPLGSSVDLSSAIYLWELGALKDNSTGVAGTDFDQLLLGADGSTLLLGGASSLSLAFINGTAKPGSGDAFWTTNHSWLVLAAAPGVTNVGSGNFSALSVEAGGPGHFTTSADAAGNVSLNYSVVPEPGSWVSLLAGSVTMLALSRRRKSAVRVA